MADADAARSATQDETTLIAGDASRRLFKFDVADDAGSNAQLIDLRSAHPLPLCRSCFSRLARCFARTLLWPWPLHCYMLGF